MRIDRRTLIASALAAPGMPALTLAQDEETPETEQLVDEDPPWILLAGEGAGPRGRWGHTLIMDGWNGRLLAIGGRDGEGTVRGDLWTFDLASYTWSDLDLSGPKARSGSAAAMAPDGSGFYYFGGESNDTIWNDLWWFGFAGSIWQPLEPTGRGPSARSGTRRAIDALGRFVISHGQNGDDLFDDTWAYDPGANSWTDISPDPALRPMARSDHEMISLPDYGLVLLYGGCSDGIGPCPQGDLWAFDVYGGAWSDITPYSGPTPRTGAAMARAGSTILLVGGLTELGPESDVWGGFFDGSTIEWTEHTLVNHGPMGIYRRFLHDMTVAGDEFYVFAGEGVEGAMSDLWQFSLERLGESEHTLEPGDQVQ